MYADFANPMCETGRYYLPMSGQVNLPEYKPLGTDVYLTDFGGTVAGAKQRDKVIRAKLGLADEANVKNVLTDYDLGKRVSQAQEEGIESGEIEVNPLEGVERHLEYVKSMGVNVVGATVGTRQMARAFIRGAGLDDYIDSMVTSEDLGTGDKKTPGMFVQIYEALRKHNQRIGSYRDDSKKDALAAVGGSRIIQERYQDGFTVFLIDENATDEELGMSDEGYVIVRSIVETLDYMPEAGDSSEEASEGGEADA